MHPNSGGTTKVEQLYHVTVGLGDDESRVYAVRAYSEQRAQDIALEHATGLLFAKARPLTTSEVEDFDPFDYDDELG